jgi:hypothetical protein
MPAQRLHDGGARGVLPLRRDAVLEVEDDAVGTGAERTLDLPLVRGRHEQERAKRQQAGIRHSAPHSSRQ